MSETELCRAINLLGVDWMADDATIRKAWRALVRSYHPDLARRDRDAANRRLAEINAAYDVVTACTASERARIMQAEGRFQALRRARSADVQQAAATREARSAARREAPHKATKPHPGRVSEAVHETVSVQQGHAASACTAFEASISLLRATARPASKPVYA